MNNFRPCITICFLTGILLSSGCASIIARQSSSESRTAFYPGTVLDAGIIVATPAYLVNGADDNPWVVLAPPLLPLAVVDLGLSAVYDTLFLPHDTWQYFHATQDDRLYEEQSRYWNNAFDTDTIDTEEARPNFSDQIEHVILGALRDGRGKTNVIRGLLSLAVAENRPTVLAALSRRPELSPHQCRTILVWAQTTKHPYGDATYIPHYLARNPATPKDVLLHLSTDSDVLVRDAAATTLYEREQTEEKKPAGTDP